MTNDEFNQILLLLQLKHNVEINITRLPKDLPDISAGWHAEIWFNDFKDSNPDPLVNYPGWRKPVFQREWAVSDSKEALAEKIEKRLNDINNSKKYLR